MPLLSFSGKLYLGINMSKGRRYGVAILFATLIFCSLRWSGIMQPQDAKTNDSRFDPERLFKGRIFVSVIERRTGPEEKVGFVIDLDRGEIRRPPNPQFEGPLSAGGRIDCWHQGPIEVPSPNSELVARCTAEGGRDSGKYVLGILKRGSRDQVRQWLPNEGSEILGMAWSADSKSVAVLLEEERKDLSPLGLLSAASGHPIPLETFKAVVLSAHSETELRLPTIRRDSPSAWARIDWIE